MQSEPVAPEQIPGRTLPTALPRRSGGAAAARADAVAPAPIDAAQLAQALQEANRALMEKGAQLSFELDDQTQRVIVRLVDKKTGDVLRQIPSREALAIARALAVPHAGAGLVRASA
jgi:flagellar protein FlaG